MQSVLSSSPQQDSLVGRDTRDSVQQSARTSRLGQSSSSRSQSLASQTSLPQLSPAVAFGINADQSWGGSHAVNPGGMDVGLGAFGLHDDVSSSGGVYDGLHGIIDVAVVGADTVEESGEGQYTTYAIQVRGGKC